METGGLTWLTNGMDPALSPDGRTVAFVREGGEHGLYLVDIDGGNERLIYSGGEGLRAPSWSPDGSWIVFSRETGEWECRAVGGGLCFGDNPFLSEFPLEGKAEYGLSVVDVNGENFQDVAALNTARAPSWGEGGIVYQASNGIEVTGFGPDGETRAVASEVRYGDPDLYGNRVVFQSREGNHHEIFVSNVDGSGLQALTRPVDLLAAEYAQNVSPVWSEDGTWIAFLSNRGEDGSVDEWAIWVMAGDGTGLQRLPIEVEIDYDFQGEQVLDW
jgi:Tol biopolymer transport system component